MKKRHLLVGLLGLTVLSVMKLSPMMAEGRHLASSHVSSAYIVVSRHNSDRSTTAVLSGIIRDGIILRRNMPIGDEADIRIMVSLKDGRLSVRAKDYAKRTGVADGVQTAPIGEVIYDYYYALINQAISPGHTVYSVMGPYRVSVASISP